jgi:putative transposase
LSRIRPSCFHGADNKTRSRRAGPRAVVGGPMSHRITRDLILKALPMAPWRRNSDSDLLHHSDRGSQYASGGFQGLLDAHGIVCSMSGTGNRYDNAARESFFGLLKRARVIHRHYRSRQEARTDLFESMSGSAIASDDVVQLEE